MDSSKTTGLLDWNQEALLKMMPFMNLLFSSLRSVAGETHHNFPLSFWKSRLGILTPSHYCLICCQIGLRSLLIAGMLRLRHRFGKSSKESQELRLVCHRASWNLEGIRESSWKKARIIEKGKEHNGMQAAGEWQLPYFWKQRT